ncbi:hypothetical protein EJB05_12826, partial [Eragrostis curvula]
IFDAGRFVEDGWPKTIQPFKQFDDDRSWRHIGVIHSTRSVDRGWAAVHRSTVVRGIACGGGRPGSSPPVARVDGGLRNVVAEDERTKAERWVVRVDDGTQGSGGSSSPELLTAAGRDGEVRACARALKRGGDEARGRRRTVRRASGAGGGKGEGVGERGGGGEAYHVRGRDGEGRKKEIDGDGLRWTEP